MTLASIHHSEGAIVAGAAHSRTRILLLITGAMALGAAYAALMGEDANWDWQNYHEYNVWALLNGGYGRDAIPPGFQTYFNPLIYFPWYALRHALPPLAAGMVMGALHGLNLVLVGWLTQILLGRAANALTIAGAVLLAASGPMTLSEVGTSFADITTALPIIAGLALMLGFDDPRPVRYVCAGLLVGLAVGFKLTNIVFALGLGMAALAAARPLMAMGCLALGGAIGCVLGGGAWSLMLWREFGNPLFPLMNSLFPSPEMQQVTILDRQFIPRGWLDALAYPLYWAVGDYRSSELPFRDARFALLLVLAPLAIAARLRAAAALTRRDVQFMIFVAVSYSAWLGLFAIQRYAVTLELLCGPAIVLVLVRLLQGFDGASVRGLGTRTGIAILAVAVLASAWTQPGDWWRRPWSNPYRPLIPVQLAQPASYILLDKPLSYIVPQLTRGSRFYQIADQALPILPGGRFDRRIRAGLQDPLPGGVWELHITGKPFRAEPLAKFGLAIDTTQHCVEIEGAQSGSAVTACPLLAREP